MRRISKFHAKSKLSVDAILCSNFHSSQVCSSSEDYHTLGLPENASKDEVKAAYFSKAKEFHPDSSTRYLCLLKI